MTNRIDTESKRTLKSDLRRTGEYITDHKPQIIGGVAVALAVGLVLGGSLAQESTRYENAQTVHDKHDIRTDYLKSIAQSALEIADPNDVIGEVMIIDSANKHPYTLAMAQLATMSDLNTPNNIESVDISAKANSAANYIQPGSAFVLAEVDVDHNGTKEVIVERAPSQLPTK